MSLTILPAFGTLLFLLGCLVQPVMIAGFCHVFLCLGLSSLSVVSWRALLFSDDETGGGC